MLLKSHLLRKRIERTSKLVRKTLQNEQENIRKERKTKTNRQENALAIKKLFLAKHVLVWSPFFV